MRPIRNLSARPEIIVDTWAHKLFDPATQTYVGFDGPLSRDRVVFALPTNKTKPIRVKPAKVVHDHDGFFLCDPDSNLIGFETVIVERMVEADVTEDTRRP
jgi:hypothetical protein